MGLPFYIIFALPFFLLLVIHRYKKSGGKSRAPPGPPGLPIIGNLHQIDASNSHEYFWKLSKQYGPLMSMKLGSKSLLVISSAKMAEEALKTHDVVFSGRCDLYSTRKLSYNGMDIAFAPYGDYWREMRKIGALHLFSVKQVQSFRPIREEEVKRMIQHISKHASTLEVLNLSDMITSLTSTLICRVAFGKSYDAEGGYKKTVFDDLLHDLEIMLEGFFFSNYLPSLGWIDKLTGVTARMERTFKGLDSFSHELVEEHLKPNRPQSMENDIISLLLKLREEKSIPFDLTMDHIKALLADIFSGGTDTSAVTITWAMTALMMNPRIMKKVQAEIRGLGKTEGLLTEDDIQNFPYLKAIVKETLRLFPPIPLLLPRETIDKCVIDGYEIQPKTIVFVNAWAIARDPEYWDNPHEFLPERYLNSAIDYRGQHFGLIPFGAGRRGCPGISMGVATVELTLANLLNSFDWELPAGMKKEDIDIDALPGLGLHKKNPLCLVPVKRTN